MNAERGIGNIEQAIEDAKRAATLNPDIVKALPAIQRVLEMGLPQPHQPTSSANRGVRPL
jgi:hypothetical protein